MEKRLLLLVNPCAGQRRANRALAEILREILSAGWRCETYVTACRGDATRFAAAHAGEFDRVVCAGGDGTLNETISGVLQSGARVPIGYIPAGTTNDYASTLGLSTDLIQAARDAAQCGCRPLDIGSFNGRYFTYTASCGAFTSASYSAPQSLKNMIGYLAYLLEGIKDIPSLRAFSMSVEADDVRLEDKFLFCAVTNSTSVGGILKLDADAIGLNDGVFELMLVRRPSTLVQLRTIVRGIRTMEVPNDMIHFLKAKRIAIDSEEPIEWTLDGERFEGAARAELNNLHSAVDIVVPERPAEAAGGEAE